MYIVMILLLYIVLLRGDEEEEKRFGVVLFFLVSLSGSIAYISGLYAGEARLLKVEGYEILLLERHKTFGLIVYILSLIYASYGGYILYISRGGRNIKNRVMVVLLLLSVVGSILMGIMGKLGGILVHTELREDKVFDPFGGRIFSKEGEVPGNKREGE